MNRVVMMLGRMLLRRGVMQQVRGRGMAWQIGAMVLVAVLASGLAWALRQGGL